MRSRMLWRWSLGTVAATLVLAGCERPPVLISQSGYRGVGQEHNANPRILAKKVAERTPPAVLPAAAPAPPAPAGTYQNVHVLTDLSQAEFNRTMQAMTNWVAPKQGCLYCHNPANMASDEKYQKVVSRRMLQMTRNINTNWQPHVAQTGVTCYTCHAGNPVPHEPWYYTNRSQVLRHLLDRDDVRVQSHVALASDANRSSIKQTEYTYSLMLHMSRSLGVNCTFCHNSRQWFSWDESSPKRLVALRGIRMARELNLKYLVPLQSVWPATARHGAGSLDQYGGLLAQHATSPVRLGPMGDGPKIQCATCHNGAYKPLYGAAMAKDYPGLHGPETPAPAAPVDTTARSQ